MVTVSCPSVPNVKTDSSVCAAAFLVSLPEKPAWMERFLLLCFLLLSLVSMVKQVFFHSKHVALVESHHAISTQCNQGGDTTILDLL